MYRPSVFAAPVASSALLAIHVICVAEWIKNGQKKCRTTADAFLEGVEGQSTEFSTLSLASTISTQIIFFPFIKILITQLDVSPHPAQPKQRRKLNHLVEEEKKNQYSFERNSIFKGIHYSSEKTEGVKEGN